MSSKEFCFIHSPFRADGLIFLLSVMMLGSLSGCSKSGPQRLPVSGHVTLDDAPLASGVIRMIPQSGSEGPGAATTIVNGEFQFDTSNGPVAGTQRVEIEATGFQGFEIDDEQAYAAAFDAKGESPLANNPVPAKYHGESVLSAPVAEGEENRFTFDLKSETE